VRNEEGLEGIVEVRDQFEVIQWHEGDQLHVLKQGPQRKEANVSEEQD
jgi:hypothetical protein